MKKNTATLILHLGFLASAFLAAQAFGDNANVYVSDVDHQLTIHKVGILPVTDNVSGLYSRYVENKLGDLIKSSHRFSNVDVRDVDTQNTLDDFEGKAELIKSIGRKSGADALIAAQVSKDTKGINLTVDLFLVNDGLLLSQETITNDPKFSTTELEIKTVDLFNKVIEKIPYKGLILSRQGNRVTIDIGTQDGLRNNSVLTVEQILAVKRHPKFKFIVSTEKEILGKVKIVKADETLSFGVVLQEKAQGVIIKDSKVSGLDFVTYSETDLNGQPLPFDKASGNYPKDPSFGKNPKEWLPPRMPSLGKIGVALGIGSFHNDITLKTAGSYSTDVSIYPQIDLHGELWLTKNWYVGAAIQQGVLSVSNPSASSSPSKLGSNNAHYDFLGGYKFLLQDDFWGPQINLHAGLGKYSFFVDASTPLTFTSMAYNGMYIGFGGSMPVTVDRTYYLDVNLDHYLFTNLTEDPASSGASSDNSVTRFSFGGSHKLTGQLWLIAHLDFEFYSTNFTGLGSRGDYGQSASQSLTTLFAGIEYMF